MSAPSVGDWGGGRGVLCLPPGQEMGGGSVSAHSVGKGGLLVPPGVGIERFAPAHPSSLGGAGDLCLPLGPLLAKVGSGGVCQTGRPRVGDAGLCLPPRAVGDSSPNVLITLIFPQCLDGIDYDDFNFGSHMMEQKEPLMETGKGPSACALPGSPAAVGFPSRLTHTW